MASASNLARHATAAVPVRGPVPCPLCGSTHSKVLYTPHVHVDDPALLYGATSGIQGAQTIVQCLDCPMIYENPRFPEAAIIAGYSSSDDAAHDSQHAIRTLSFVKALRSLSKFIPEPGAKVLDIGTAGGAFLEAAEQFGFQSYGLEPSRYLVNSGKARGLNIQQGTIEHNNFKPDTFDMITFWDVLEHLAEPKRALQLARPLLKKNGLLLINYPDIGTWQAKLAGSKFWWLMSVHLAYFNRASISEICKRSGYEIVTFKPYWQTLQLGYLQNVARDLGVPTAGFISKLTPGFMKKIPIPYHASQTICIAKAV